MLNAQNALRAEAVQCGAVNDWWRDKAQVRTPTLVWEDKALPWLAEWEKRVIAQGAKVMGTAGSLVEEVKSAKGGADRFLKTARKVAGTWDWGLERPTAGAAKARWPGSRGLTAKAKTKGCELAEKIKAAAGATASRSGGVSRRAGKIYLGSLGNGRGEAEKWAAWVPGYETGVWFRRLKKGAIPPPEGAAS